MQEVQPDEVQEYVVNDVYIPYLHNEKRYLIFWGGAGSGKSVFVCQKIIMRCLSEEGHRFLAMRKIATTLRGTVFQLLKDVIRSTGTWDEWKIRESDMHFHHVPTGNEIMTGGMDDPEKIKSIAGITGIWMEEATDFTFDDFTQLDLRLRGQTKNYKQIMLSFNPVDESHWIKVQLFDNSSPEDMEFVQTTYLDNHFCDEEYKKVLNDRVKHNENYYRIYVLGNWGKIRTGGEAYDCFSQKKTVGKPVYDPNLPLHLTFDFNVNPYPTLNVWQLKGKLAVQIDEICPKTPRNRTKYACEDFVRFYSNHQAGVFIYGDPAGKHQDTRSEQGHNDFEIIRKELAKFHPTMRVDTKAPPVKTRIDFLNAIFANGFEGIEIMIHEKCINTINDYNYLKMTSEGEKHKEKEKDPITKLQYEKYGHTSDANDYFLCKVFSSEFQYFKTGKRQTIVVSGHNDWNDSLRF